MHDTSTTSAAEFLSDGLIFGGMILLGYINGMFRCLPGMSYGASLAVLIAAAAVSVPVGDFVVLRWHRSVWSAVGCVLLVCGIYTLAAYRKTLDLSFCMPLLAAGVLAAVYTVCLVCRRIRCPERRRQILCGRLYRGLWVTHGLLAAGVAVMILRYSFGGMLGFGPAVPSVRPVTPSQRSSLSVLMEENIDTLLKFHPEQWEQLSTREKLDALQTLANMEACYLGLPHELNVRARSTAEDTAGHYEDGTHRITLSLSDLEDAPPEEVMDSLCHEVYHSYQHRLVDLYRSLPGENRELRIFAAAEAYMEEFADYVSGEENYENYYTQRCEQDARDYAEESVQLYFEVIYACTEGVAGAEEDPGTTL